jgi:hypothetical protein
MLRGVGTKRQANLMHMEPVENKSVRSQYEKNQNPQFRKTAQVIKLLEAIILFSFVNVY